MQKLTKKIVESTLPQNKDLILWDSEVSGFMCKITPAGKKSYFLYYRTQDRRQRRPKIGDHSVITCEQARNMAQRWLLEVSQGNDPSGEKQEVRQNPTLKELSEKYMKEHAPHKKLSSRKEDQRLWNQFILPTLGSLKVSSIERSDIAKLHHSLQHLPTTANRVRSVLSKALNLAELWGYRPNHSNPCLHIKKYGETKRERFLSHDEIARLMEALTEEEKENTNPWPLHAIRLLLITGCRLNEILTLKWEEVDLENQCLRLRDSKTGKKLVYLSTAAIELLNNTPQEVGNPFVICGGKEGAHLINLQKPWRRIRAKVGLDDVRIHDLRHTFASIAASNGLSLPIIGALLGHKQTQTTARYAHLIGQPLIEASEK
ncbi:MAG: tyrosine-type recombinase/integrase, partial [Alphaproteobacteria bacterium]|nr:tyrosine-type recombinase/integrase [Alphaproteobacteria bacterium]